jgi:hypothetical protein
MTLIICDLLRLIYPGFLRLSRAQNDLPVDIVKKNPLKRLFLTEVDKEKRDFQPPRIVGE